MTLLSHWLARHVGDDELRRELAGADTSGLGAGAREAVEELRAVVDETHGWGKKVACHAYSNPGMQRALDGGIPAGMTGGAEQDGGEDE